MKTYIVKYAGAVEVEAENKSEAEDIAWTKEAIHAEDITSIELTK